MPSSNLKCFWMPFKTSEEEEEEEETKNEEEEEGETCVDPTVLSKLDCI